MPKLEPKVIQKELDQGMLWPVYWLYGQERMKVRELLKRIRRAVLAPPGQAAQQEQPAQEEAVGLPGFNEETLDATEVEAATILDAAQSMALGGGRRLIVIRDAHALRNPEPLEALLGARGPRDSLSSVCVFLSRDLDARRKFSKLLAEKAAVVPCEEVPEPEREAWVQYLARRRGVELPPELAARMTGLDPWSLDIIDLELEKFQLAGGGEPALLEGISGPAGSDVFLAAFFNRDLRRALEAVLGFAEKPDQSLPLLGLFGWNLRQLTLLVAAREKRAPAPKLNPYVVEKLQSWSRRWRLAELAEVQSCLSDLDFSLKQKPLLPLGIWSELVLRFCVAPEARA